MTQCSFPNYAENVVEVPSSDVSFAQPAEQIELVSHD
jgi:hypothetical protein